MDGGGQGNMGSVYFNRRWLCCFRAGDDSLASVPDKVPGDEWNYKIQGGEGNEQQN
jgi:hypothetical protein